jgi:hypothetical protein
MNIFGIEVQLSNSNGKYVKRKECHEAHNKLERFLDQKFTDTNIRINDLKDSIDNYIDLLKNGK